MINVKEKLFKEIDDSTKKIFLNKLKIAETIENSTRDKPITYLITDNPSTYYNNDQMYIDKIVMFLRKYQDFMYKVLVNCKSSEGKMCLSSLVSNFFYINTLSSSSIEDEYLVILYRTLTNEIETLKNANSPQKFLEESINAFMVSNLLRNDDVKTYFGKILNEIIEEMDSMNNNQILNFDPIVLNEIIKKRKELLLKIQQQNLRKTVGSKNSKSNLNGRTNSDSTNLRQAFTMKDPSKGDTSLGSGEVEQTASPGIQIDKDAFFRKYIPDLLKKELIRRLDNETNNNMKEYIMKQINEYKNNDNLYANTEFLENVYKSSDSTEVLVLYQINFSIVIGLIEKLLKNLNTVGMISMKNQLKIVKFGSSFAL